MNTKNLNRAEKQKKAIRVTLIGSLVDTLLGISKIAIGYLFNSHALIVDGIHSFSDLFTDGIVLYLGKLSHEAPDKNHPYGHEKFETIGSAALGSLLIATGGALIYNTAQNLISGKNLQEAGTPTLIVAIISIISKEVIFQYSYKVGDELKSKLLMANAWHSRTDAISSVVVLIGLILGLFGYHYFDEVAALIVSLMIAKVGWSFVKESLVELADTSVNRELILRIKNQILETDGVQSCHALRTRRMAHKILVDVNIEVSSKLTASEGHEICAWVSKSLKENFEDIEDVTVHLDIEDDRVYQSDEDINPYIHEYDSLLPLRSEVLEVLNTKFKGALDLTQINDIRLYYIKRKIDVEIVLKEAPNQVNKELQKKLQEKCSDIPWMGQIKFLFSF